MMDDQTALILALQLVALCCIAAALLMYLLCRIRNRRANNDDQEGGDCGLDVGLGRAVLITSCDTVLGLQCALHLSWLGFRVFAGFKNVGEGDAENGTLAVKILKAKLKERETLVGENDGNLVANMGSVVPIPLDVTREDMLHEAVGLIRRHLPAGEDEVVVHRPRHLTGQILERFLTQPVTPEPTTAEGLLILDPYETSNQFDTYVYLPTTYYFPSVRAEATPGGISVLAQTVADSLTPGGVSGHRRPTQAKRTVTSIFSSRLPDRQGGMWRVLPTTQGQTFLENSNPGDVFHRRRAARGRSHILSQHHWESGVVFKVSRRDCRVSAVVIFCSATV
uniref:Uncharacterized protein n=1 Tax=Timema bartmani TaxID=61472 RepID=A0A7R9EVG9_9NEOP|nr:unnamed protein product [Timema bartmani]